ncbi:lymphocyte-specific protein 1-like [Piliocolobus tephrosceles]|uniref:lymphocyte-specific protein 1-like n=1 Tax=Piliocolobus tephrosceles TaxID=591936 RepID=UPI000E6AEB51|nr:lymphocyte-specific protein 1-like [Piliocolobus tephrosceles]
MPGLHACEKEDGDEAHLEELSLSKEGPEPEDTVQDNPGAAGAEEEQEELPGSASPAVWQPLRTQKRFQSDTRPTVLRSCFLLPAWPSLASLTPLAATLFCSWILSPPCPSIL